MNRKLYLTLDSPAKLFSNIVVSDFSRRLPPTWKNLERICATWYGKSLENLMEDYFCDSQKYDDRVFSSLVSYVKDIVSKNCWKHWSHRWIVSRRSRWLGGWKSASRRYKNAHQAWKATDNPPTNSMNIYVSRLGFHVSDYNCNTKNYEKELIGHMNPKNTENVKKFELPADTRTWRQLKDVKKHYSCMNPIFESRNFLGYGNYDGAMT